MDEKLLKLIALYEDAGEDLLVMLRGMADHTWSHRRTQDLIRQVQLILANLTTQAGEQAADLLTDTYKAGAAEAINSMVAQGLVRSALDTGLKNIIHQEAVQAIVDDTFYSILEASDIMLKDVKHRIEEVVRRANVRSLVEGVSRRQATKDAVAELADRGITGIVTKSGAQVPADKYMSSVIHYHQRKAHVTGVEQMALQNGQDLVYVNFVGITCRLCAGMQGRVYSLSGNDPRFPQMTPERKPPYHSHCVHSTSVWVESYQSEDEVKRLVAVSDPAKLGHETRHAKYIKRYDELQKQKARINETRKQWIRYKARMPDMPSLKQFASQKARGTAKYMEWQEDYRRVGDIIRK